MSEVTLQAPEGQRSLTIHGREFIPEGKDRIITFPDESHAEVARRHGCKPPGASAPVPATPQTTAPEPAPEPAPYATGPYQHVLAWLRGEGHDIADGVADSALLRLADETLAVAPEGEEEPGVGPGRAAKEPAEGDAPDPEQMTQPAIVRWLRERGVTIPGNITRDGARDAMRDYLAKA